MIVEFSTFILFLSVFVSSANAKATLSISPKTLSRSGDSILIKWSNLDSPSDLDWLGIYSPPASPHDHFIGYKFLNASPTWQSGSGAISLPLTNLRSNYTFRIFRWTQSEINPKHKDHDQNPLPGTKHLLAESEQVGFGSAGVGRPEQIHLAFEDKVNRMQVTFVAGDGEERFVRYGEAEDALANSAAARGIRYEREHMCNAPANSTVGWRDPGWIFHTVMKNLNGGVRYYYQVGSDSKGWSEIHSFIARDIYSEETIAFMFGDMGCATPYNTFIRTQDESISTVKWILRDIEALGDKPALVSHIGDISYARGYSWVWDEFFAQIEPIASRVPYHVCIGNHEYDFPTQPWKPDWGTYGNDGGGECGVPYSLKFNMPGNSSEPTGTKAPPTRNLYYSYDMGSVHFLYISTETNFLKGGSQYEFVKRDLESVNREKTPFVVVQGHRPMYTTSNEVRDAMIRQKMVEHLEPLFVENNVTLALWGHVHRYERFCPISNNTCGKQWRGSPVHLVIGMGGQDWQPIWQPRPNHPGSKIVAGGKLVGSTARTSHDLSPSPVTDPSLAMAESSGKTLMDLISADPTPVPPQSSSSSASSTPSPAAASAASSMHQPMSTKTTLGEKKSKRATLMQIQSDTISVAKAALNPVKANIMPQRQRQRKKPVSYTQLARSIHELAATLDQKSSQKQLVNHVFPKLAVYNSVDPSLAPSLLMLNQQCEDRNVLRYVYYYLARILSDTGLSPGGGIPTPNWDALADIDAGGGVTRADVVPRIVNQLTSEASNSEVEFHARRLQALKALTYSPSENSELLSKLYEIVFGLLDKVADVPHKRKKGVFGTKGGDKESIIRSNLQYAAMSALRRLPLDPGNPVFLHRAAQGVSFADPVAVRHSLEILAELAARDPYTVAMTLEKLASPAGALQDILHLHDVLARVALARLCHGISRARALDERPDIRAQFNSILYQLLLDPSERVCYEAILCILGKYDNTERMDERASGWYRLTREILKLPEATSKDKSNKAKRPQPLIKLVMRRLESSFRSFSRPVLHAAARVVQEMGKSRAAAFAMGLEDIDESVHVNAFSDALDDAETNDSSHPEGIRRTSSISAGPGRNETIASLLASLMEVVRTTVACECVYVRGMVVKALIWMQSPHESLDELKSIIASELSDPAWPASLVNDVLLTLHARFKATPDMAVILLEIARIFATKVPGKIDADVLQLLWKTCLVGAGPDGKHTALEAVTIVLDLPPPQPGSMSGLTSIDRVSASDPKSALALQKLVQAAVWFLGENANYAASEYAWESATPPGTALMMLDADKMVAAASSRNPTLAGALTRLQRCAFSGSWEVRIVAIQALTTIAIRSGEPFRLQIYEFLNTLAEGGVQSQLSEMHLSNGEDQGVSGTGLGVLITPMLKVLDEMYQGQDELIREIRNHDNANKEWKDEELKKLYETHERLLDFVSLFCYIPRAKYLPLGPISAKLIDTYRTKHNITASSGVTDPTVVATGISDLIYESTQPAPAASNSSGLDDDLVNAWAANLGDDGLLGNNAPAMSRVNDFIAGGGTDAPDVDEENVFSRPSVGYDDMWAKTLLETNDQEEDDVRSGSSSPDSTGSVESSISSHFGGMNYPSLFSSKPSSQTTGKSGGSKYQSTYEGYGSPIREEPPPPYSYSEPQSRESFENPMAAGSGSRSYESDDEEPRKSTGTRFGTALYDFTAGGDDELNLTAEEELEIEYEVDGWFYVKKKRPGRDGKMAGLVPVLYVNQS